MTAESAREEALRLAREAGFDLHWPREPEVGIFKNGWVAEDEQIERLIALARQREGWVWVPREPTPKMRQAGVGQWMTSDAEDEARQRYKDMLAAAPQPGEGT